MEFLSKILGLIAARGIGFILLYSTVKHRATVVKMKGRSGGKDHINDTECGRYFRESAQMGVGGGLYLVYHF